MCRDFIICDRNRSIIKIFLKQTSGICNFRRVKDKCWLLCIVVSSFIRTNWEKRPQTKNILVPFYQNYETLYFWIAMIFLKLFLTIFSCLRPLTITAFKILKKWSLERNMAIIGMLTKFFYHFRWRILTGGAKKWRWFLNMFTNTQNMNV